MSFIDTIILGIGITAFLFMARGLTILFIGWLKRRQQRITQRELDAAHYKAVEVAIDDASKFKQQGKTEREALAQIPKTPSPRHSKFIFDPDYPGIWKEKE